MQDHVRQKMNNIVVDWLFQLHRSAKPSFLVGAIKICKLVTREGPTTNVFQRITVEFCNRQTFPPRTIYNIRYAIEQRLIRYSFILTPIVNFLFISALPFSNVQLVKCLLL